MLKISHLYWCNNHKKTSAMPRKKKQKISIEDIKKKTPKIVFYTDKLKINLKSMSSLDFWFAKYPNGKYIVND